MGDRVKCLDGGIIVGTKYPIPEDPRIFYKDPAERIGCNLIHCNVCDSDVRHVDGYRLTRHSLPDESAYQALYDASGTEVTKQFRAAPEYRTYFCRCSWADTFGFKELPYVDSADGWYCPGHPQG